MNKDSAYLEDILAAISDIEEFLKSTTESQFYKNKEKQYAVLRGLEIIGEATKNISKELKEKHSTIPWKDIAGMRDKLIHYYFGVKLELVWETVKSKLPELRKQILRVVEELTQGRINDNGKRI